MFRVFVDADGCPVKEEVCRVARRYEIDVLLVANAPMRVPEGGGAELVLVGAGFDEADDWIVAQVQTHDVVVTGDIPLAARCLARGARVVGPKGRIFTEESIGGALANREFLSQLREHGTMTGGPAPFAKKDRSRFLQSLDTVIQASRRASNAT
ncbi:MAG: YaiI/YqxD family protein [Candidatus Hydrogenedentes bacterium]|nr:YaiI/YqxD family protein [Candidatus Hydrogenedentota bacterium]